MIQKLKSMKANKKGFTLAELLIVVAIIAVLAAIAIPAFAAQLENARLAVDQANLRAATSMAAADYQMNNEANDGKTITYIVYYDKNGDTTNLAVAAEGKSAPDGYAELTQGQSKTHQNGMTIQIKDAGQVVKSEWNKTT